MRPFLKAMKKESEFERQMRVLLVEDDEVDVEALRRAARARNLPYDISVATDGGQALKALRDPDQNWNRKEFFILLDLNMPGMNGHQFLAELRADERYRRSMVFVLTTSGHERDIKLAYDYNICGYFLKSDINTSLDTIARYVETTRFPPGESARAAA